MENKPFRKSLEGKEALTERLNNLKEVSDNLL